LSLLKIKAVKLELRNYALKVTGPAHIYDLLVLIRSAPLISASLHICS